VFSHDSNPLEYFDRSDGSAFLAEIIRITRPPLR
jgi:hypothetical protein